MRALLCITLLTLPLLATLPSGSGVGNVACAQRSLAVSLEPGAAEDLVVVGMLCEPGALAHGTIALLLSGATEGGRVYWDFPGIDFYGPDPTTYGTLHERYSFSRYLAESGIASLALDRIGIGASSRPLAASVTIESNAYVVHQVVQALREGELGRHPYGRVVGVGRSLSGPILYMESATYGDLDAILVQSFRRHQTPQFALFPTTFWPAQAEEHLAAAPPGYLTTRPSTRHAFFDYVPLTEPAVLAHEEAARETITPAEVATLPPSWSYSESVTVPVYSMVGDRDILFCSAPGCPEAEQEAAFFPKARCFRSLVVPDAGHDMGLQVNNRVLADPTLRAWILEFGPGRAPCG